MAMISAPLVARFTVCFAVLCVQPLAACSVAPVDFSEKRCPCDEGFVCDAARDMCVAGAGRDGGAIAGDDLLLDYPLDVLRVDGAEDVSGDGRDATCADVTCPTATEGRVGGAARFDGGEQHLTTHDDGSLVTARAFTAALWIAPDRLTRATAFAKRRDSEEVGVVVWALEIDAAGRASFVVGSEDNQQARVSSDVGVIIPDMWRHLAGSWDGIGMRLYVDGVEVAVGAGDAAPSRGDVLIGGDDTGPDLLAFSGALDEARLYARELDEGEIAALATP